TTRGMHPDFGGDSGDPSYPIYGLPYIVVAGNQPRVPVTFEYADESDYAAPTGPPGYPIPNEAKTEQKWIEGGLAGGDPSADGDRHMLIVDRDNRILFEVFATRWNATAGRWEGGSGAIFPLDSNQRRPDGWTSADAAGLAILPGLVRYDEASGDGPIRHALRVTVRATNGYVFPGSHRAGSTVGALPMGARLRLKASKDISGFPEPVRKIFQAMKTYGLIVADNGSDLYVTGAYDTRWNNDILNPAFRAMTASDFEIIQLGWQPSSQPPCMAPIISMQPSGGTIRKGSVAILSVAAAGTEPLTVRWFRGVPDDISAEVGTGFSVAVAPTATTSYWARVSNGCGATDSQAATVTVLSRRRAARR
ncbi:MAG TPA: hypothetical protein VIL97_07635, partial [Thermoanaerobaculia bacterium]